MLKRYEFFNKKENKKTIDFATFRLTSNLIPNNTNDFKHYFIYGKETTAKNIIEIKGKNFIFKKSGIWEIIVNSFVAGSNSEQITFTLTSNNKTQYFQRKISGVSNQVTDTFKVIKSLNINDNFSFTSGNTLFGSTTDYQATFIQFMYLGEANDR